MQTVNTDDIHSLLAVMPPHVASDLKKDLGNGELLEVVMDLGRLPEARFPGREVFIGDHEVTDADIQHVTGLIGAFSGDNRAGLTRTLHRISAIRNREGKIVGLTCRVGRAVMGTARIIQDLVETGKNVLLMGPPGIGKTTILRETARVLADDLKKRVIVVDTSNEIAGDGDIPHPAIGHARRMQVPMPTLQHAVMIEAVENHMPEVIIIDEIGTSLEADAARTIAERGVQLVGTAHGNSLENLLMNPTLSDLIGGIQTVTLGDEEARRRHTQKSVLERKAPPTFDIVVEIQERYKVLVHPNVANSVDALLHNQDTSSEVRWLDQDGQLVKEQKSATHENHGRVDTGRKRLNIFLFGINRPILEQAAHEKGLDITITDDMRRSNLVITTKNYFRRKPQKLRDAEIQGIPVYAIRGNSLQQLRHCLDSIYTGPRDEVMDSAMEEAMTAIEQVKNGKEEVELSPQNAFIRRLQHLLAERHDVNSMSAGREPGRRVKIVNN
ncbi:MAG: AAA family ATPase [Chloroflexi bacterium]|nr:AAA family ATPase [Chloroflexota bacterium]